MKCQLCDGTGRLIKPWYDTTGLMTGFTGDICFVCDGTGEITEETAKKITNFDRITESPEALAEFICDISFYFPWDDSEFCCRYNIETEQDRLNFVRDWLNEESKE